jgi:transcriptional regulator with XRE-family HTH domain
MKSLYDEMKIRALVALNLKRLRELKRISQITLSGMTGLTRNFINDIENGAKWVSAKTIAKLASALEVEPHRFFLSASLADDTGMIYLKEFQDSLAVFVRDYSGHYLSEGKGKTKRRKKTKGR